MTVQFSMACECNHDAISCVPAVGCARADPSASRERQPKPVLLLSGVSVGHDVVPKDLADVNQWYWAAVVLPSIRVVLVLRAGLADALGWNPTCKVKGLMQRVKIDIALYEYCPCVLAGLADVTQLAFPS